MVDGLGHGEADASNLAWKVPPVGYKIVGGKLDGKTPEDTTLLQANSAWRLSFGEAYVKRGMLRVEVNPVLYETATVGGVSFLQQLERGEVFLVVKAFKNTDFSKLDYIIRCYTEE